MGFWKRNQFCRECREGKRFYKIGTVKYDPDMHHTPDAETVWHPESNPKIGDSRKLPWR